MRKDCSLLLAVVLLVSGCTGSSAPGNETVSGEEENKSTAGPAAPEEAVSFDECAEFQDRTNLTEDVKFHDLTIHMSKAPEEFGGTEYSYFTIDYDLGAKGSGYTSTSLRVGKTHADSFLNSYAIDGGYNLTVTKIDVGSGTVSYTVCEKR